MVLKNHKKIVLVLFAFVFCHCYFLQVANPQTYLITEEQLQPLEMEFQNLKTTNLNLNEQNLKLQNQAKKLNGQVAKLTELSTNRQNTIQQLTESCSKLEIRLANEREKNAESLKELSELKIKNQKQKTTIITLSFVILLLLIIIFFCKRKKIF